MAIAIRGTSPGVTAQTTDPTSVVLNGTRQPQSGDVLTIIHFNDFYTLANMPTPTVGGSTTGVTPITSGTADAGTDGAHVKSYTYVVGATGDLTVAVDETGAADEEKGLAVYVLSGVDTGTPIDIAGNDFLGGSSESPHVLPSISPTSSDAFLICHVNVGGGGGGAPYTLPGVGTSQYNSSVGGVMAYAGTTEQLSASGATGTRTFTPAGGPQAWAGVIIAVKTAAAGGGPVLMPRSVVVAG